MTQFSVLLAVNLAGWLVEKFLKLIWLGFLDHLAGLVIGAAKAYVLACAVVVGLLLVLADGTVLRLGSRTHKNKTGFDLGRLFVGSAPPKLGRIGARVRGR